MSPEELRVGERLLTLQSRLPCEVGAQIGKGGQGGVYRCSIEGLEVALKWYADDYHQRIDPLVRHRLETAYRAGPPAAAFLWPFELVGRADGSGLGYLMPIRDPRFRELQELMRDEVQTSFSALARLGFHLADCLLKLHAKGLCYQDLNFGNIFFDPVTGEACICDNDNVDIDGSPSRMAGTYGFQAPEIVRGEAYPRIQTDLFSLAVLLFLILMIQHPLLGRRQFQYPAWDAAAQKDMHGLRPVFIFDPRDERNRPAEDDIAPRYWSMYPGFIRDLFTRSFTIGLRDPVNGRVREGEWRQAMSRLRDCIHPCSGCGAENFYDQAALASAGLPGCWQCGHAQQAQARLRVNGQIVMLYPGAELFRHHLTRADFDFSQPWARVEACAEGLQLVCLYGPAWRESGQRAAIGPGQALVIREGLRVHFERDPVTGQTMTTGEFRMGQGART